jgi:hypothetical protein
MKNTNPLTGDKRVDFQNKAASRTAAVLDALRRLGNCGNKATYESTPEELAKIDAALDAAVAEAKRALRNGPTRAKGFSL